MVSMIKRAIFPTLLGLLLLTLIACGGDGGGGEEASEPTAAPATAAPVLTPTPAPTATRAPAVPAQATAAPSPTLVATEGDLFLQLVEPAETEVFTDVGSLTVVGRTRVDAVVTINDTMVEPNIDGEFSLDVPLEEGPNIIEVVVSVASGEQMDLVLVVIYLP